MIIDVVKTTTQDLPKTLAPIDDADIVGPPVYQGGRDWVVLVRRDGEADPHAAPHRTVDPGIIVGSYLGNGPWEDTDGSMRPSTEAYAGWIEDTERTWVLYLDGHRRPAMLYLHRNADGGVLTPGERGMDGEPGIDLTRAGTLADGGTWLARVIFDALAAADCNCTPGDGTCEDWTDRSHRLHALTAAVYRRVTGHIPADDWHSEPIATLATPRDLHPGDTVRFPGFAVAQVRCVEWRKCDSWDLAYIHLDSGPIIIRAAAEPIYRLRATQVGDTVPCPTVPCVHRAPHHHRRTADTVSSAFDGPPTDATEQAALARGDTG